MDECLCQCHAEPLCLTVNYFGRDQRCLLFSILAEENQLQLTPIAADVSLLSFPARVTNGEKTCRAARSFHAVLRFFQTFPLQLR